MTPEQIAGMVRDAEQIKKELKEYFPNATRFVGFLDRVRALAAELELYRQLVDAKDGALAVLGNPHHWDVEEPRWIGPIHPIGFARDQAALAVEDFRRKETE